MGVIPNPKMAFIFPIPCILVLIFPIFMIYFPKFEGKGSFPKSQINHWYDNGLYCLTFDLHSDMYMYALMKHADHLIFGVQLFMNFPPKHACYLTVT